ncbi:MAG: PDZ domain-containing protein [Kiritimatiellia bacterium]
MLRDPRGDLILDAFEVVSVIPGSPADGHLQPGDLLVAMDGEPFRTATALRPEQPLLLHQGTRSLEMDAANGPTWRRAGDACPSTSSAPPPLPLSLKIRRRRPSYAPSRPAARCARTRSTRWTSTPPSPPARS